jgi:hypothetical protein
MNNKNDGVQDTNIREWWKEQKKNYTIGRYDKSIVWPIIRYETVTRTQVMTRATALSGIVFLKSSGNRYPRLFFPE